MKSKKVEASVIFWNIIAIMAIISPIFFSIPIFICLNIFLSVLVFSMALNSGNMFENHYWMMVNFLGLLMLIGYGIYKLIQFINKQFIEPFNDYLDNRFDGFLTKLDEKKRKKNKTE